MHSSITNRRLASSCLLLGLAISQVGMNRTAETPSRSINLRFTLPPANLVAGSWAATTSVAVAMLEPRKNLPSSIVDAPRDRREVSGVIQHSFNRAATSVGVPPAVIDEAADLLGHSIDFRRDIRAGDRFTIDFEWQNRKPIINFVSVSQRKQSFFAVRYDPNEGKPVYLNEHGEVIGNYFLRYPVQFTRITSVFTKSRFHPILKVSKPHNGVDLAAPKGTPVRAIGDAQVVFAGWDKGGGGYTVKLRHTERYSTAYLHLSKIAPGIRTGQTVVRGEVIGSVGMTGAATGPHLHFSLYDRGKYVDPLKTSLPQMAESTKVPPRESAILMSWAKNRI